MYVILYAVDPYVEAGLYYPYIRLALDRWHPTEYAKVPEEAL